MGNTSIITVREGHHLKCGGLGATPNKRVSLFAIIRQRLELNNHRQKQVIKQANIRQSGEVSKGFVKCHEKMNVCLMSLISRLESDIISIHGC